jgi:hypothetical protein
VILGRMSEASDEVADAAEVVCSLRIVVLCAIQELLVLSWCRAIIGIYGL